MSSYQRPLARVTPAFWHEGNASRRARTIPDEVAVAFTYNQSTHAVMMASPADLAGSRANSFVVR